MTSIRSALTALSLMLTAAGGAVAQGLPDACRVTGVAAVTPPAAGLAMLAGDANSVIVGKLLGGSYQLVRVDLRTRQERCLTCKAVPGGPAMDRDKAAPVVMPGDAAVLLQVQQPSRPGDEAASGWLNDLWLMSIEGERWANLTRYPTSGAARLGALYPIVSADGRSVAWAEYRLSAEGRADWRLRIGSVDLGASGGPSLKPQRAVAIPGATIYEPLGWSRDGRALVFAANSGRAAPGSYDLWTYAVDGDRTAPLEASAAAAEAFGVRMSGGRVSAVAVAAAGPGTGLTSVRRELHLVGEGFSERVTAFNAPGQTPGADGSDGSNITQLRWSPDGRAVWMERRVYDLGGRRVQSRLTRVAFAGACGAGRDTGTAQVAPGAIPLSPPQPAPPPPQQAQPVQPTPPPMAQPLPSLPPGVVPPDPSNGTGGKIGINTATSIEVGGVTRSFRIVAPQSMADGQPRAIVFAFHGLADSNRFMSYYTGLDEAAEKHGFLLIYPQARVGAWPLLLQWIEPDLRYFDALVAFLSKHYNVDRNRIYATGMSNGAYFINLLAAHRSRTLAAIAMHSGGVGVLNSNDIKPARKYPVMIVHGQQDVIINIREGRHARKYYQDRGHEVEYVELPGHNHFWAYSAGINDRIWAFFQAHPMQR